MTIEPGVRSLPEVRAIDVETIQSRVHRELREMLMMGRFRPGQAFKIVELAEAFGTSAQPVRESIRQLVAERALEAIANRSARVPATTVERLEDLQRVRLALERLAAELATARASAADIASLRHCLGDYERANSSGDVETIAQCNMRFHFALYALSGSETLISFIESLWLQIGPAMRQSAAVFDGHAGRGNEMHDRIIAGLEARDAAAVSQALADDINRSFQLLIASLPPAR